MIRYVDALGLFLLPFALFCLFLAVSARQVSRPSTGEARAAGSPSRESLSRSPAS